MKVVKHAQLSFQSSTFGYKGVNFGKLTTVELQSYVILFEAFIAQEPLKHQTVSYDFLHVLVITFAALQLTLYPNSSRTLIK